MTARSSHPPTLVERVDLMEEQLSSLNRVNLEFDKRQNELVRHYEDLAIEVRSEISVIDGHLDALYSKLHKDIIGLDPKSLNATPNEASIGGRLYKIERLFSDVLLSLRVMLRSIIVASIVFAVILIGWKGDVFPILFKVISKLI